MGESHYQADLALQEAVKYGKNDGFVISGEDNALTGPLSLTRSLNYSYSNTRALDYSQKNGINESNLLKIVGLFQMDKDTVMTAASLSQWLNITSRSCNRILQQLLDSNLIEEIESQKQEGKGRPTRQYRFCKGNFIRTFFCSLRKIHGKKKECVEAYSRAKRGRLRQPSSSRECAS